MSARKVTPATAYLPSLNAVAERLERIEKETRSLRTSNAMRARMIRDLARNARYELEMITREIVTGDGQ